MKRLFLLLPVLCLSSCQNTNPGYHKLQVTWAPGYENIPDCNPLFKTSATSVDIKGLTLTTPQGVAAGVGGVSITPTALQQVSDAAIQADAKYVRLCEMLPSYSHDQTAFYKTRDQMFGLIAASTYVASQVAEQAGVPKPSAPPSVPTAAPSSAIAAGSDPARAIANPVAQPAAPSAPASGQQASPDAIAKNSAAVTSALNTLKSATAKKVPSPSQNAPHP
jgi:hypothetical protein